MSQIQDQIDRLMRKADKTDDVSTLYGIAAELDDLSATNSAEWVRRKARDIQRTYERAAVRVQGV
jgi:hypothetical protein